MKLTVKVVALTVVFALTLALLASLPGQPVSTVKAAGVIYAAADGILEGLCPITAPCTIQRAVSLASVGDTIYLKSGTYTAPNEADTRVIWITKSLTLTGSCEFSGKGAVCSPANEPSIIDGELKRRVIFVQSASTSPCDIEINYLHIQRGNAKNPAGCNTIDPYISIGCGGGILVSHGDRTVNLQVNSSKFWFNFGAVNTVTPGSEAGFGGAIYFQALNGDLEVNDTFFQQNAGVAYGRGDGGAIFAYGNDSVLINGSGFSENYCSLNSAASSGCAIFAGDNAEVNIERNLFNLNNKTAYLVDGGAIKLYVNDHFIVHGNILTENTGASVISGARQYSDNPDILPDVFSQNWLWNNNATDGIYYLGQNAVNIFNNFIGHWPDAPKHILSGIRVEAVTNTKMMDVNILHNSFGYLDHGISLGNSLNVELTNNIIAYNRVDAVNAYGSTVIINPDTNLIYGNPAGDLTGPNLITADPRFVNGEHGNFHLLPIFPGINAGLELGYSSDIDNEHRPVGLPDIGADEYTAYIFLPMINR